MLSNDNKQTQSNIWTPKTWNSITNLELLEATFINCWNYFLIVLNRPVVGLRTSVRTKPVNWKALKIKPQTKRKNSKIAESMFLSTNRIGWVLRISIFFSKLFNGNLRGKNWLKNSPICRKPGNKCHFGLSGIHHILKIW